MTDLRNSMGIETRLWVRVPAAVAAASAAVFIVLALVLRGAAGTTADVAITAGLQRIDHPAFAAAMMLVSAFGNTPLNLLVLATIVVGIWLAGSRREALFVVATQGAALLNWLTKLVVARPRPGPDAVRVASELLDYSFPSGHVASYVSLYGFLFFLVYVRCKRSAWRTAALTVLGLPIGLVGVSRIYLGYHWASDVVGGYALGTAYLVILIQLYRALRPAPAAPPAVESASRSRRAPLEP
jgi:membrane-associated phospholipid phosphatase